MRPTKWTHELLCRWRENARVLEDYGAMANAKTLLKCASELEELAEQSGAIPLTLKEASELSGYSRDHLGRMLRAGKIPNAGRPGAPRIARKDVPFKPGKVARPKLVRDIDRTQIVRSAINAGEG